MTLIVSALALAVTIYAITISLAAPLIVERALAQYVAAEPGRSASVDRVRVNPFALEIELTTITASDDTAQISLTAPRVLLNFGLASFMERRAVLESTTVERPVLRIESPTRLDEWRGLLAQARFERLDIREGRLDLVDRSAERERQLSLDRLAVIATNLDARAAPSAASGRFASSAVGSAGTLVEIEGVVTPGLTDVRGPFAISNLDLETARPWLDPELRALAPRGRLAVDGDYAITAATWPALEILGARIELEALSFAPIPDWIVQTNEQTLRASAVFSPTGRTFDIDLDDVAFELGDARTSPARRLVFAAVTGSLASRPGSADPIEIELEGRLDGAGGARFRADVRPPRARSPGAFERFALEIDELTPPTLNPYAEAVIGRELRAGRVDIELGYTLRGQRVDGNLRIVTRGLEFLRPDGRAETIGDERGDGPPGADLAAAVLEDPQGVIDVEVRFAGRTGTDIGAIAANALRRRIVELDAAPLRELGRGLPDDLLRAVVFEPGTAGLGERAGATIEALAAALERRPRLGLRVHAGFDAQSDRNALARQQIELHVLLATAGPSLQARPEPVDFGSPRAQDVLDEFATERLPSTRLTAISDRLGCDPAAESCRTAYYAAVFDALVANEPIAEATLSRLGRFRAQSVIAALTERGITAERLSIGQSASVATAFGVGLPVEVHVFDQPPNTSSPSR